MGDKLNKYLKKRSTAIDAFLGKPVREYTPEVYHKLRVEIKKLNAFFELVNFCSKDFKRKKTFKPFKSVFDQAGKVREKILELSVLKKYIPRNSNIAYISDLKKNLLLERRNYFFIVNKKFINDLKKKYDVVEPFIKEVDAKCIHNFLDAKKEKLKLLINEEGLKAKEVHSMRKKLKEFYYILKFEDLEKHKKLLQKIDAFLVLVGEWHDCYVVNNHLGKIINSRVMDTDEINKLRKIRIKLLSDCNGLFVKVNASIKEFTLS